MGRNHKGRLTSPAVASVKVKLDKETDEQLTECSQILALPKAEVIRRGIKEVFKSLEK